MTIIGRKNTPQSVHVADINIWRRLKAQPDPILRI